MEGRKQTFNEAVSTAALILLAAIISEKMSHVIGAPFWYQVGAIRGMMVLLTPTVLLVLKTRNIAASTT